MSANDRSSARRDHSQVNRPTAESMSFESDLARIEAIVSELESDGLGLDQALKLFEEGVERLRAAAAALAHAEEKVRVLVEQTDGSFTLADVDG